MFITEINVILYIDIFMRSISVCCVRPVLVCIKAISCQLNNIVKTLLGTIRCQRAHHTARDGVTEDH